MSGVEISPQEKTLSSVEGYEGRGFGDRMNWIDDALNRFEAPMLRFATRLCGCPQRAADLVQDVFCALCRQRPEKVQDHLAEWLFTSLRNRAIDQHRKDQRMTLVAPQQQAESAAAADNPADSLASAETKSALATALNALSERQQEIIQLKFHDGLRYKEIAEVLGISAGTVAKTMHEAIARLRTGHGLKEAIQ